MGIQAKTFRVNKPEEVTFMEKVKEMTKEKKGYGARMTNCMVGYDDYESERSGGEEFDKVRKKKEYIKVDIKKGSRLFGRDYNQGVYRVCNFKKEQLPYYARALYELRRAGHPLAANLHIEYSGSYHKLRKDGTYEEEAIKLPNHYSLWARTHTSDIINVAPFWRVMYLLRERVGDGLITERSLMENI